MPVAVDAFDAAARAAWSPPRPYPTPTAIDAVAGSVATQYPDPASGALSEPVPCAAFALDVKKRNVDPAGTFTTHV